MLAASKTQTKSPAPSFGGEPNNGGDPDPEICKLERETGVEPATFCLASKRTTTVLLPHVDGILEFHKVSQVVTELRLSCQTIEPLCLAHLLKANTERL